MIKETELEMSGYYKNTREYPFVITFNTPFYLRVWYWLTNPIRYLILGEMKF